MKLVVQIPCYNEEATIGETIAQIPRQISGIERVEVLVIDDGSTDQSVQRAKEAGADHIIRLKPRKGLAQAFMAGIEKALELGADIIVNTDADNQYPGDEIPRLIEPVLKGEAQLVVGKRQFELIPGYSRFRRALQRLGSWFLSILAGVEILDGASGFRAMTRELALRFSVLGEFSYTLETLIEAGRQKIPISWVPVRINPQPGRKSRLYKSLFQYLFRSGEAMLRTYSRYEPLRVFTFIGGLLFLGGFGIGVWFLYYFFTAGGKGHIQILLLATILMIIGFQVILIGLVSDLISGNRRLLEELIYRLRKIEFSKKEEGKD